MKIKSIYFEAMFQQKTDSLESVLVCPTHTINPDKRTTTIVIKITSFAASLWSSLVIQGGRRGKLVSSEVQREHQTLNGRVKHVHTGA